MSHFYGTLEGSRGRATRCATKKSGLKVIAASWGGAITVELDHNELTGKDSFTVWQAKWQGKGINGTEPLAEGIIGQPTKKENGNGGLLDACKLAVAEAEMYLGCEDFSAVDAEVMFRNILDTAKAAIKKAEG